MFSLLRLNSFKGLTFFFHKYLIIYLVILSGFKIGFQGRDFLFRFPIVNGIRGANPQRGTDVLYKRKYSLWILAGTSLDFNSLKESYPHALKGALKIRRNLLQIGLTIHADSQKEPPPPPPSISVN